MEMTSYQEVIAKSRYARWLDDEKRRETWGETVNRYINFYLPKHKDALTGVILYEEIVDLKVMPSMRAMMTAGIALDRDNVAGFNCAYLAIEEMRSFDELMYILMCGTGVGFSVERQFITKLPEIAEALPQTATTIVVRDSKMGWASAYKELISLLYAGTIPTWDVSKVRPKGAILKTFGGRASGSEPLVDLFNFTVNMFKGAKGRKLTSLECHDLCCKIADIVVVGGVRRSALISLSNLTDERMRVAKSGRWWDDNPQRALSNNSVCYTEKPDIGIFMKEWQSLYESKSGERGIFSRAASKRQVEKTGRRDSNFEFGTNPCCEIILRSKQFCNLSEVIIRPRLTLKELEDRVRTATILGTLQSTKTNFRYLSRKWQENTEEERLLGVSLTGIMDHVVMSGRGLGGLEKTKLWLMDLKKVAIETNKIWAKKLGIEPSTAITCVKPSGTVSQLVGTSSGIHPSYSEYYIRTIRNDIKDPITQFLIDQGVTHEPAIGNENNMMVFSFPQKAPKEAIIRDQITALGQLELWKVYQDHWCDHKPSITVYVRENEWLEVGAWVYKHFDSISGISFLPFSDHTYQQAPYQPITKEEYDKLVKDKPLDLDWDKFAEYEQEDNTIAMQTLACSGGSCEI